MEKNLLCLDDVTDALAPICRNARKRGAFSTVRIENHVADKNAVDPVTPACETSTRWCWFAPGLC
ncbi:MAG: hypothetical protein QF503_09045 [Rhodospirillales bacterium]|nr:hypothetical protein [Rhodospirillales bacterium]